MKTTLPERSKEAEPRLKEMVAEILSVGKGRIAMIILFGSYARGDWVQDEYEEDHITYSYQSDFDLLVVLKNTKQALNQVNRLESKIEKRLERFDPHPLSRRLVPSASLILESIDSVNKSLARGTSFYLDVDRDGILLYDSGEFELAEANRNMPWFERKAIAQEDYNYWFSRGSEFLIECYYPIERNNYSLSAFLLHQATESLYTAILLVFYGYSAKSHDILKLGQKAKVYSPELLKVFPKVTKDQEECFKLLRAAYIGARYDKHYKITKEQTSYLIERVEMLKEVTQKMCLKKLS